MLDLMKPDVSYFFGFAQADGHLWQGKGNKGKFSIDLMASDRPLLEAFAALLPCRTTLHDRTRDTNFKKQFASSGLLACDRGFREWLKAMGLPSGKKSDIVGLPLAPFSAVDYFRGWVDANGSVGITARGFPFVSFSTRSRAVFDGFLGFTTQTLHTTRSTTPNTRDRMFAVAFFKEDAQSIVRALGYETATLSLQRKRDKAIALLSWTRPRNMRTKYRAKRWTQADDAVVLSQPVAVAMEQLGRTEKSVRVRLWRLTSSNSDRK